MKPIAELFAKIGFKADTKQLDMFKKSLKTASVGLISLSALSAGAALSLKQFTGATVDEVVELNNLSNQYGISADNLSKWRKVAELSDVTTQSLTGSVVGLQKKIAGLAMGDNSSPFAMLGLDVTSQDNAIDVLNKLRSGYSDLANTFSPTIISDLLSSIGVNPDIVNILKLTNEQFLELSKGRFLNNNQRNDLLDLGTEMTRLTLKMKEFKDIISANIAPELADLIRSLNQFFVDNQDRIIKGIEGFAQGMIKALSGIGGVVGNLVEDLDKLKQSLKTIAMIALGVFAVVSPVKAAIGLGAFGLGTLGVKAFDSITSMLEKGNQGNTTSSTTTNNITILESTSPTATADQILSMLGDKTTQLQLEGLD